MAHELGHFLIHGFSSPAPGGDEAQEPATDVCAVFLGFGVFTANAAFRFQGLDRGVMQGWRFRRLGYLGQRPLSYAQAIFLYAKNALRHLKQERRKQLEGLRSVAGREGAVS
jgi:hypothetical protein